MNRLQKSSKSPHEWSAQSHWGAYLGAAFLCVATTACSHDHKPVASPAPAIQMPQAYAPEPTTHEQTFVASAQLKVRCNLPDTPQQDPQFDFDEASLRSRGESILDDIATCMLTGPMKDVQLVVTGHADPRGTEEYNHELGMRRSAAAEQYLIGRGVPPARIDVRSRGELDATGSDERSWQLDRRVDLDEGSQKIGSNP